MLLCPVRDCHQPLGLDERRALCPRAHSFDTARNGYLNLLQPQDRKSKRPGDTPAAVQARRRLHDRGVTQPLVEALAKIAEISSQDIALDAGCGEGFILGTLASQTGCEAHGIDISIPAVNAAARAYPNCQWIVTNADRFIPYSDRSFSLVLSITARMNAPEFRRVLRDDGRLLLALPAPDDLIELRGKGRDRVPRTIESFAQDFTLAGQRRITTTADLDARAVQDVLLSIYRPLRSKPAEAMRVTFSLDLLLLLPNRDRERAVN